MYRCNHPFRLLHGSGYPFCQVLIATRLGPRGTVSCIPGMLVEPCRTLPQSRRGTLAEPASETPPCIPGTSSPVNLIPGLTRTPRNLRNLART